MRLCALTTLVLVKMALASTAPPPPITCSVLIAGGSTAALSTALTAATVSPQLRVCLTEPTDELGGQLAYNPAIDFGTAPKPPSRLWGRYRTQNVHAHEYASNPAADMAVCAAAW